MNCRQCGKTIGAKTKFCPNCGQMAHKICPSCASHIDVVAKFCPECGTAQPANSAPDYDEKPVEVTAPIADQGEYRQVTVMFCDMVDSTVLSERLDVEDLRQVFHNFRLACIQTIEGLGGHIDKYSGDGVMAIFGFPIAYEDAPKRSVLAALELLRQIDALNEDQHKALGVSIKLRIGIHSGRVVAGELGVGASREEFGIVGVTPNIAARLEGLAPHDSVAVSPNLKKLIEHDFTFESLGVHHLKGISEPMEVFRLLGHRPHDRAADSAPTFEFPLSGRDQEVATLLEAWQNVQGDQRASLALVVGEPGIGKTGLASLFLESAVIETAQLLVMTCSAYDQDTPFGPVIRMLADELGLAAERTSKAPDGQVKERIIADAKTADRDTLETLFRLLWRDPTQGAKPVLEGLAERRELLRALVQYLKDKGRPILLLLEDAHWADPSTNELVDRILRHPDDVPVLLLILSRPGNIYSWDDVKGTRLHLRGLPAASCELIVLRLTAGKPLERRLLTRLISITGGVPLFLEELTKSLLESGKLTERQGRLVMADQASDLDTPASILDLLTVRLDALGSAKMLAQVAAVIGRNFDLDALCSVAQRSRSLLEPDLRKLIDADFVVEQHDGDDEGFAFRHALYQKAAYDSLLRSNRQQLHARHLSWLESDPDRKKATPPERLAFYSEQAGFFEAAVHYWIAAGEAANSASASLEAVHHYKAGLRTLEDLPETDDNQLLHLKLLTLLGGSLMTSDGPGGVETKDVYNRAVALCDRLPESPWHFPAYWGWWRVSENFTVMLTRAERLVAVARGMKELEFSLQARHCNWANAFMVGDHRTCFRHARRGLDIYEKGRFAHMGSLYGGHDPKVCGLGEIALSKWLVGQAEQALENIEQCLAWATETGHLGSRLHALDIALMLHHYRRDVGAVSLLASELKTLSEEHELDDYRAKSLIFQGWCLAEEGDLQAGLERLEDGLAMMRKHGTHEDFPVYFSMIAACRTAMGDGAYAIGLLEEGLTVIEEEGVTYWAAEIYRHYAETLMQMAGDHREKIDDYVQRAVAIAQSQNALALELRAIRTQARQLRTVGAEDKALANLREVTGRFKEGRKSIDFNEALRDIEELEATFVQPSHAQ